MSARSEAAASAIAAYCSAEWPAQAYEGEAEAALQAADELMFSEAMEARVAQMLYETCEFTWQVQASMIFRLLRGEE